jgi:hypothetical protein
MLRHGGLTELSAWTLAELEVLCDAQTRLVERLTTAQYLNLRHAEMQRQQRVS